MKGTCFLVLGLLLGTILPLAVGVRADEASPADSAAHYDLRYKFAPGEIIRSEVIHRATVDSTIQGSNQNVSTRTTSIKVWKVNDVKPSGETVFVHSVESVDMWQQFKGRLAVTYNSQTDKAPPPGFEDVSKSVGVPLTIVTLNARGKVLHREEKHAQAASSAPITLVFPDEPIAVGHVWSVPVDMDVLLQKSRAVKKIEARQQCRLEQVNDDIATIAVEWQVLTPINDPEIEVQLVQRLPKGTVKFNLARGRIERQQLDVDRQTIGFAGPASSMHFVSRVTEKLLPSTAQTAARAGSSRTESASPASRSRAEQGQKKPRPASSSPGGAAKKGNPPAKRG